MPRWLSARTLRVSMTRGRGTSGGAGVEVLLDDDVELLVEGGEGVDDGPDLRLARVGGDAHAQRDGLAERQVLPAHPLHHLGVHLLDVHQADAVGVGADQVDGVHLAVLQVPGVQAEGDVFGIGLGEEPVDLFTVLDVGVAVGVNHHGDVVVLLEELPQAVGVAGEEFPIGVAEVRVLGPAPGLEVAEHGWQVHQVVGADGLQHGGVRAHLALGLFPRLGAVQDAELGAGHHADAAFGALGLQYLGVGGEETEGAGLDHLVPGLGDLVEEGLPIDLFVVLGEPDSP